MVASVVIFYVILSGFKALTGSDFEHQKSLYILYRLWFTVAGAEGVEPSTNGFGDRYSTN